MRGTDSGNGETPSHGTRTAARLGAGFWLVLCGLVVWAVFALSGLKRQPPLDGCPAGYRPLERYNLGAEAGNPFSFYGSEYRERAER